MRYNIDLPGGIEFDWDEANRKHLATHKVAAVEFEQVLNNVPVDLGYEAGGVKSDTVPSA